MAPEVVSALVHLVANAQRLRVNDAVTIERLVDMGVPKEHAADLLSEISNGLKAGASTAVVGVGEWPTNPPASPLSVAAFAEGHRAVLVKKRWTGHMKLILFVVAAVVCLLIYYFSA